MRTSQKLHVNTHTLYRRSSVAALCVCALAMLGLAPAASAGGDLVLKNARGEEEKTAVDYSGLSSANQMVSDPEVAYVNVLNEEARSQRINEGWKFVLGDQSGAQRTDYDDSSWKNVNLPHDYSISQDFTQSGEAESGYLPGGIGWYRKSIEIPQDLAGKRFNLNFDGVYMDATIYVNGQELANHPYGYTPFSVDATDAMNPGEENVIAVRVNHQTPSSRWYSGSGIYRDVDLVITDPVHVGYSGVQVTAPSIGTYSAGNLGVNVKATVENEGNTDAAVTVKQTITKKGEATELASASAQPVTLAKGAKQDVSVSLSLPSPTLWSLDNPALYTVTTEISVDGTVVDTVETTTGFRQLTFDANTGFALNGQKMKLKGVSMHHDQGALGAAAYRDAIERQIDILKEMGANAIRVTHNPASRDLIELADEKGIILIEEIFDGWHYAKNGNNKDYARFFEKAVPADTKLENVAEGSTWAQFDLETTLRRDLNAPSIISWSLGNEIGEGTDRGDMSNYTEQQAKLIQWAQAVDPTRPVTRGDNQIKWGSASAATLMDSLAQADGLVGLNYVNNDPADTITYDSIHQAHPTWPLYGSETASAVNSRGVYNRSADTGQTNDKELTSYDGSKVGWGAYASQAWYDVITRDFVAGEFVWTGFDYIGEPTFWNGTSPGVVKKENDPHPWPAPKNSYFGIIDTAGLPKDSYYLYQSQWNDDVHTLHILPAWNEDAVAKDAQGNVPVVVYSDARSVELFFTGADGQRRSLGEKTFTSHTTNGGYTYQLYEGEGKSNTAHENLYLTWQVPYEDGTLEAVAKDANGQVISDTQGRNKVSTAGEAAKIELSVNRESISADNESLAYVTAKVTDADGNLVPDADHKISFSLSGAGQLMGTDAGKQADHTPYASPDRNAYHGLAVAIAKSTKQTGSFTVTAQAEGLDSAAIAVTTTAPEGSGAEKLVDHYEYPRNYYVKVGNKPALPEKISATYTDASTQAVAVTWDEIAPERYSAAGSFTLSGTTAEGHSVSAKVTMIDQVAAVLNYSTTTSVGEPAALPAGRPGVLPDGTVLYTSFPVQWEEPKESEYATAGTVDVAGTATVFGQEFALTATIRVQEAEVSAGANVASSAAEITQNIQADMQSDTLAAIRDGHTASPNYDGGGANPNLWSNYKNSNDGASNTAEIIFRYDTQAEFAQFNVYFAQDTWAARYPGANTVKWYVSDDGSNWGEPLPYTESIGEEQGGNVKKYTYDIAPTQATYVKLVVTNKNETIPPKPNGKIVKPCTAITEVELLKANRGDFAVNDAAEFESMSVNGTELTRAQLDTWAYQTLDQAVEELEAVTLENAALTILPEYEKVVRLIVESEDHQAMNTFRIELGTPPVLTPEDSARDVPVENLTVAVDNFQAGNAKENVLDGKPGTLWHTSWSNNVLGETVESLGEKGWIVLILDEPENLEAVRYLPRNTGGNNGRITGYEIYLSDTEDPQGQATPDGITLPAADQYKKVASGEWENDAEWKIAEFDQPSRAKYVLLKPTATVSDQAAQFVSAAEIRLRKAPELPDEPDEPELIDISAGGYALTVEPTEVDVDAVDGEHPAVPNVITVAGPDGAALVAGVDFEVSYEGNTDVGEATVKATGIGKYTGTLSATYTIKLSADAPPEGVHTATAVDPATGDPASCTVKPHVLIADTEGVQYMVNGQPASAGEYVYPYGAKVTVTAQAKEGYELTNPDWKAEFSSPTWASLGCASPEPGNPGSHEDGTQGGGADDSSPSSSGASAEQPSLGSPAQPSVKTTPNTGSRAVWAMLASLALMAGGAAALLLRRTRA